MDHRRVRILKPGKEKKGVVVYWMSRDQRAHDNWTLLFAQKISLASHAPLVVVFCLVPRFLDATARQYLFMLKGLQEVENDLATKNVPFFLLPGSPEKEIPVFLKHYDASQLVTDFDPLRIKQAWKKKVGEKISIPFREVDAHNIVPCWIASPKQEYGAHTLRPKIRRLLPEFLTSFPKLQKHPYRLTTLPQGNNWKQISNTLMVDHTVPEVTWLKPGGVAAKKVLLDFLGSPLADYGRMRNDPTQNGQSQLSPYLHFGQLSAQRVALEVVGRNAPPAAEEAFLEELIVRRELADNFCFYNASYDSFKGFPRWAQVTLHDHRKDPRAYSYTLKELENARTHDDLWNAAQTEMIVKGKMHGYLRMYWAKKILEWAENPEQALRTALYLNDKYELDGRDPNGYAGIAWSIGGVHDRPWKERGIFGKIRYMSYQGMNSKFNITGYIKKVIENK
ncbi:MAG: deoxyribodipyrimidine photo-lyase [Thermodesulfobacteriota bacterium]|jgi:deoxyribodipyrimidine photo-lyase|nr:MAG: deoxyribodipyrimidine photo-lyase [Thermodesulfobacteriota bacterium]